MSQGKWNKKLHELPISGVGTAQAGDIVVRHAGPTEAAATRTENYESLLGLFDAKALNDALVLSGWTLGEEIKILTDLVRGEPYTGIQKTRDGTEEVQVLTVEPKVRLAARKELRSLMTEIGTLNGIVRRMTSPETTPQLSVTVKGNADGVMQLLAKKQNSEQKLLQHTDVGTIDVSVEDPNATQHTENTEPASGTAEAGAEMPQHAAAQ